MACGRCGMQPRCQRLALTPIFREQEKWPSAPSAAVVERFFFLLGLGAGFEFRWEYFSPLRILSHPFESAGHRTSPLREGPTGPSPPAPRLTEDYAAARFSTDLGGAIVSGGSKCLTQVISVRALSPANAMAEKATRYGAIDPIMRASFRKKSRCSDRSK